MIAVISFVVPYSRVFAVAFDNSSKTFYVQAATNIENPFQLLQTTSQPLIAQGNDNQTSKQPTNLKKHGGEKVESKIRAGSAAALKTAEPTTPAAYD